MHFSTTRTLSALTAVHQGFFTRKAYTAIAQTTINTVSDFERGSVNEVNRVSTKLIAPAAAQR